jgi:hypothetical protein
VWLEVRIEHAVVKGSTSAAARELALALVARGLSSQGLDVSAADALAEIEQSPDEAMADDEAPSPPAGPAEAAAPATSEAAPEATPTPAPTSAGPLTPSPPAVEPGGWGVLDSAVVMLAVGVLALSLLGAWWLLGR